MSNISPPQQPPSTGSQSPVPAGADVQPAPTTQDDKSQAEEIKKEENFDDMLANRMAQIVEDANEQLIPICEKIRKHFDNLEAQKEEDRDEDELIKQVKPLIEQADKLLNETNGAIRGLDENKQITNRVKIRTLDHSATPAEQRLAEALKVLVENVQGTIDWAKDKLQSFPKAQRDLGPLLDALGQPITQIVGGVGLLLAGVLNLLGNLLSGLGLDSLLKGVIAATGLDKIYKGLGLDKWLKGEKSKN
ncbi:hypothetical protein Agabi119p4_2250 [Agaricus bisporus var. burnettii]|uniref:DUF6987 domain-containing protein n=1 Tax=Agaricus bisporus var. burnettii TaxID=192524 RepID=A0A8H7F942_AGABI|nr:hypothetical protein Agabi119p4_2250 [Agaricus bisporus var. burnettii]